MTSTDVHTLSGAFALHALSGRDSDRFTRHLTACVMCATEVAELRETVARLADDTWSIPPSRLRAKVIARIRRIRQHPPIPLGRQRIFLAWLRWPPRPAILVSAGLCMMIAITLGYLTHQLRRQTMLAVQAEMQASHIQAIVSAPDAVIRSGTVNGGGTMTVILSPAHHETLVILSGVNNPGPGRTHQLWLINATTSVPAGIRQTNQSNATWIILAMHGTDLIGLTAEPASGSATPTLPILAQIPVR